jgi:hypothetical protein
VLPSTEEPTASVLSTPRAEPGAAPPSASPPAARVALGIVALGWAALLAAIARQRVFLTSDMVSNHVHVWYVADRLWHGHGIPLRMPLLASGDAWAFPYAFPPWLLGAALWPLGGDRVVTALLVTGAVAVIAATYWALPRLRDGWWAVVALLNPALVVSLLLGQLPFLWAAAAFIAAIGMWRRRRPAAATALAALALVTHPAVMVPISLIAVAVALPTERRRRLLIGCWLLSVAVAVPAIVLALTSPVVAQTSRAVQLANLGTTVGIRILVLAFPVVLDVLAARWRRVAALPISLGALCVVLLALAWQPFQLDIAWSGVTRTGAPRQLATFTTTPPLQPGRVYRILSATDEKFFLYQAVRAGAVLDSELFQESLHRTGFASDAAYARFLAGRHVQSVVVTPDYGGRLLSDEPARLASLAASGACVEGVRVRAGITTSSWRLYDVELC